MHKFDVLIIIKITGHLMHAAATVYISCTGTTFFFPYLIRFGAVCKSGHCIMLCIAVWYDR